jgi:DNA-binding transcriptional regulator YhcF (GntR family)
VREGEAGAPVIQLDEAGPQPKYQQIVEQVKAHVVAGRLAPGAPLPSVRQLASDLGINVNTVIAAYRALEAEEIVLLRHGSRAVIHPRLARRVEPRADDVARLRLALERARTEALLTGMRPDALRALALEIFADTTP